MVNGISAHLYNLPVQAYNTVWSFQKVLAGRVQENTSPDSLLLLEHEPVFTLGRTAQPSHYGGNGDFLRQKGLLVQATERGGSVTYHGPGQIVGYPILRLRKFCSGPKTYVRMLEEVILRVLHDWGIEGRRVEKYVGVWVSGRANAQNSQRKIAALGVRIERGVTFHGFALNVTVDLKPFEYIVPCGIEGCRVTSMAEERGESLDIETVRARLAHHFREVFGLEWVEVFRELPVFSDSPSSLGYNVFP